MSSLRDRLVDKNRNTMIIACYCLSLALWLIDEHTNDKWGDKAYANAESVAISSYQSGYNLRIKKGNGKI